MEKDEVPKVYRRHGHGYPWTPGFRRFPPWMIVPGYFVGFFLLWTTLIFAGRGLWGRFLIFSVGFLLVGAAWALWMRHDSINSGVPVTLADWQERVRRADTSADPERPVE